MLLEGEDLVVDDGQVMVRTVAGLKPVSVLWRRMDASFVDPLELRYDSRIGTPGMVEARCARLISMINAPRHRHSRNRASPPSCRGSCKHLLGTGLELPEIATWWCGQAAERECVLDNFDDLMIGPAFATALPFDDLRGTALGASMTQRKRLSSRIASPATAATMSARSLCASRLRPSMRDGKLEPRPITLRVFAARTENGWA